MSPKTKQRYVGTRDGIPSIADYAHYNEEAAAVWWAENRYDMENPPEPDEPDGMDDPFDYLDDDEG